MTGETSNQMITAANSPLQKNIGPPATTHSKEDLHMAPPAKQNDSPNPAITMEASGLKERVKDSQPRPHLVESVEEVRRTLGVMEEVIRVILEDNNAEVSSVNCCRVLEKYAASRVKAQALEAKVKTLEEELFTQNRLHGLEAKVRSLEKVFRERTAVLAPSSVACLPESVTTPATYLTQTQQQEVVRKVTKVERIKLSKSDKTEEDTLDISSSEAGDEFVSRDEQMQSRGMNDDDSVLSEDSEDEPVRSRSQAPPKAVESKAQVVVTKSVTAPPRSSDDDEVSEGALSDAEPMDDEEAETDDAETDDDYAETDDAETDDDDVAPETDDESLDEVVPDPPSQLPVKPAAEASNTDGKENDPGEYDCASGELRALEAMGFDVKKLNRRASAPSVLSATARGDNSSSPRRSTEPSEMKVRALNAGGKEYVFSTKKDASANPAEETDDEPEPVAQTPAPKEEPAKEGKDGKKKKKKKPKLGEYETGEMRALAFMGFDVQAFVKPRKPSVAGKGLSPPPAQEAQAAPESPKKQQPTPVAEPQAPSGDESEAEDDREPLLGEYPTGEIRALDKMGFDIQTLGHSKVLVKAAPKAKKKKSKTKEQQPQSPKKAGSQSSKAAEKEERKDSRSKPKKQVQEGEPQLGEYETGEIRALAVMGFEVKKDGTTGKTTVLVVEETDKTGVASPRAAQPTVSPMQSPRPSAPISDSDDDDVSVSDDESDEESYSGSEHSDDESRSDSEAHSDEESYSGDEHSDEDSHSDEDDSDEESHAEDVVDDAEMEAIRNRAIAQALGNFGNAPPPEEPETTKAPRSNYGNGLRNSEIQRALGNFSQTAPTFQPFWFQDDSDNPGGESAALCRDENRSDYAVEIRDSALQRALGNVCISDSGAPANAQKQDVPPVAPPAPQAAPAPTPAPAPAPQAAEKKAPPPRKRRERKGSLALMAAPMIAGFNAGKSTVKGVAKVTTTVAKTSVNVAKSSVKTSVNTVTGVANYVMPSNWEGPDVKNNINANNAAPPVEETPKPAETTGVAAAEKPEFHHKAPPPRKRRERKGSLALMAAPVIAGFNAGKSTVSGVAKATTAVAKTSVNVAKSGVNTVTGAASYVMPSNWDGPDVKNINNASGSNEKSAASETPPDPHAAPTPEASARDFHHKAPPPRKRRERKGSLALMAAPVIAGVSVVGGVVGVSAGLAMGAAKGSAGLAMGAAKGVGNLVTGGADKSSEMMVKDNDDEDSSADSDDDSDSDDSSSSGDEDETSQQSEDDAEQAPKKKRNMFKIGGFAAMMMGKKKSSKDNPAAAADDEDSSDDDDDSSEESSSEADDSDDDSSEEGSSEGDSSEEDSSEEDDSASSY